MDARACAARLRDGAEVQPHLQPARCPRRDQRDGARRHTSAASAIWRARSRRATTTRVSGSASRWRATAATQGGRVMARASLLVELQTEELPPKALKPWRRICRGHRGGSVRASLPDGRQPGFGVRHAAPPGGAHHARAGPFGGPAVQAEADAACRGARRRAQLDAGVSEEARGIGREHMAEVPLGKNEGSDTLVVEHDGKADAIFLQV